MENSQFKVLPAMTGAIASMLLFGQFSERPMVMLMSAILGACFGFVTMPMLRAITDFCQKMRLDLRTSEFEVPHDGKEHPPVR